MEKVRYETEAIKTMIREVFRDPYQRSFLFLIYLNSEQIFDGHYLSPYLKPYERIFFHSFSDFKKSAEALISEISERDRKDMEVACFEKWVEKEIAKKPDYVLCFSIKGEGKWKGQCIKGEEKKVYCFDGSTQLEKMVNEKNLSERKETESDRRGQCRRKNRED